MLPHSILPLCLSTMLRLVTFGMPTKVKGQFTRISFLTSFVPFSVEEIVPHELLSARYVEYPYIPYQKVPCFEQHRVPFISIVLGCF